MDLRDKISTIHNLMAANKFSTAIEKCHKLIKIYPKMPYLYNLCGMAYQSNKQILKSVESFNLALHYEPESLPALNNLANSYKFLNQSDKAEILFEKILNHEPNNIKYLNNYANLKKKLTDFNGAKKLLLKAEKIEGNNTDILFNLLECFQSLGDLDTAKKYAFKILELKPDNTAAHRFISGINNYKLDKSNFDELEKLEKSKNFNNLSVSEKKDIYYSLGKVYEDLKDYENSFIYLDKANSILRQQINYNILNEEKLINKIIKLFQEFDFDKINKKPLSKKIVFIVGMPRSGTTLVEQMIASHSEVNGAGELVYLRNAIVQNFLEELNFKKQKIIEESLFEKNIVADKYLQLLSHHKFSSKVITDKAPQNFIWLGFIKIFFPNSYIIHCKRNPKDNCLSLYKNYFPSKEMLWSFDQEEIAKYYNLYIRLMEFWHTKINDSILDVEYEKVVKNPEIEMKKIISFCNLDWEENCLNFHKNKKTPITTASVNQARKPIYNTSVNSNEGFANYLEKMFNILDTNK